MRKPDLTPLQESDYIWAANELGVDVASIKAVAEVETKGRAFLQNEKGEWEPVILFERHWFRKYTKGKYNKTHPDLSGPYKKGSYGLQKNQHKRLQQASDLDREAALMSASWGKFQLMGGEYKQNGYDTIQDFINDMYKSERGHLEAFVGYIKNKPGVLPALKQRNWARFAYLYNGSAYKDNRYDIKMAQAYNKFKNG